MYREGRSLIHSSRDLRSIQEGKRERDVKVSECVCIESIGLAFMENIACIFYVWKLLNGCMRFLGRECVRTGEREVDTETVGVDEDSSRCSLRKTTIGP